IEGITLARSVEINTSGSDSVYQQVCLSGAVENATSQALVPGAVLTLSATGIADRVITANQGYYHFVDLPAGSYNLVTTYPGYTSVAHSITLTLDGNGRVVPQVVDVSLTTA